MIEENSSDKSFSDDEKDIHAMRIACRRIDYLDMKHIKKHHDSWYYLMNIYDMDVTYRLDYINWILVRDYNMALSKRQRIKNPLLHCYICGSSDLSTYGFNNNGRRRIKCNKCKKISVIKMRHFITEADVRSFLLDLFKDKFKNKSDITSLTEQMCADFSMVLHSYHFEELLSEQKVITHALKNDIIYAFFVSQVFRLYEKRNTLDLVFRVNGYHKYTDCYQHIPLLPKEHKEIITARNMEFNLSRSLKLVAPIRSTEEVKRNRLFYQVSAAYYTDDFYGWEKRVDKVFEELKISLTQEAGESSHTEA
jgi:transcription elongation factor Elf1